MKIMLFSVILITKFEKGNVIEVACEVLVDNKLADPYLSPVIGGQQTFCQEDILSGPP